MIFDRNDWLSYLQDGYILMHHGIKGQQWGVRNGPPYPLRSVNKKRVVERFKNFDSKSINRSHSDYNVKEWGSKRDKNILFVTGISGSGKSTLAKSMASKGKAEYIDIDLYTFKTAGKYDKSMSKSFNKYLDENVPNWRKMQKDAYAVLTKTNRRAKKQTAKWFDTFENALLGYGEESYGSKKVVADGVQILDETLFYNNKGFLKDKPLMIMDTSVEDSILSRAKRDNKSINKLLEPDRVLQLNGWMKDIDHLKKTMN